jgi:hypothetical protein
MSADAQYVRYLDPQGRPGASPTDDDGITNQAVFSQLLFEVSKFYQQSSHRSAALAGASRSPPGQGPSTLAHLEMQDVLPQVSEDGDYTLAGSSRSTHWKKAARRMRRGRVTGE